jgi:hypothetical protein
MGHPSCFGTKESSPKVPEERRCAWGVEELEAEPERVRAARVDAEEGFGRRSPRSPGARWSSRPPSRRLAGHRSGGADTEPAHMGSAHASSGRTALVSTRFRLNSLRRNLDA